MGDNSVRANPYIMQLFIQAEISSRYIGSFWVQGHLPWWYKLNSRPSAHTFHWLIYHSTVRSLYLYKNMSNTSYVVHYESHVIGYRDLWLPIVLCRTLRQMAHTACMIFWFFLSWHSLSHFDLLDSTVDWVILWCNGREWVLCNAIFIYFDFSRSWN